MSYIAKAIYRLIPDAEFSFTDDDYSTIKWDVLTGTAPTQAKIDETIEQIKAEENTKAETDALAKAALLDRLGITPDEAQLLLQ